MGRRRASRKRVWVPIAAVLVLAAVVVALRATDLVVPVLARPGESNVPTIPCDGRYLAEGFTYRFRDPHRGELVVIHARGGPQLGTPITPDPHGRDLNLTKRVIGVPGDTVVGRGGRVLVNGGKADDIATGPFTATHLGPKRYFVLGDNRSVSDDSRDFGPVPRAAIFGRVFLIYWPLGRVGAPGYDKHLVPKGEAAC